MTEITSFVVARDDLARYHIATATAEPGDLADGEVLLAIDSFSFTANNITYAQTGDVLRYWQFFPAPEAGGIIPVWGFADIVESRHAGLAPRERLFGFWPMASHARLAPSRVDAQSVVDGAPHRRELPATYNGYQRCAADPIYDPATEDIQSIFRGLFSTGFLIDDFLADRNLFGGRAVVLSSASSKTAYSLAHQLHRRGTEAIGLTSPGNRDFVERLGVYSRVLTYDQLTQIDPAIGAVFVDFAGSGAIRTAIHNHFADQLKYSMAVGMSHGDPHPPGKGLLGPRPEFFFAPAQRQKRVQDWGRDGFATRLATEWHALVGSVQHWLHITHGRGRDAVGEVYLDTLRGSVPPDRGQILSL